MVLAQPHLGLFYQVPTYFFFLFLFIGIRISQSEDQLFPNCQESCYHAGSCACSALQGQDLQTGAMNVHVTLLSAPLLGTGAF